MNGFIDKLNRYNRKSNRTYTNKSGFEHTHTHAGHMAKKQGTKELKKTRSLSG